MIYYGKLRGLFEGSGLSYKQLAQEVGLHWVTLIKLANSKDCDEYNISLKAIDRICTYFKVQPFEILEFGSDRKVSKKGYKDKVVK